MNLLQETIMLDVRPTTTPIDPDFKPLLWSDNAKDFVYKKEVQMPGWKTDSLGQILHLLLV